MRPASPVRSRELVRLRKSSVLIVGNGGAARGAAFALSDAGRKIALVGRNADRVRALSKICGAEALLRDQLNGRHFDAIVHATPLGMFPHVNECFFNGNIPADVVFDMVYNPLETAADAARAGAGQVGGSRAGYVHRAGGAAVRDLDRRIRAASGDEESRHGSTGA